MSRYLKLSLIALLALITIVPVASARPRSRVVIGGYFGPSFYGPGWYGPGFGWGWNSPYGYDRGPVTGSVKFETKEKDRAKELKEAAVYVDGVAGTVGQLKTFQLRPGAHNLELRGRDGHAFYQERVNVIAGKTLKLIP